MRVTECEDQVSHLDPDFCSVPSSGLSQINLLLSSCLNVGPDPDCLSLEALKIEARTRGTTAQVYYEAGSSERFNSLILESQKTLGKNNVFIVPKKD